MKYSHPMRVLFLLRLMSSTAFFMHQHGGLVSTTANKRLASLQQSDRVVGADAKKLEKSQAHVALPDAPSSTRGRSVPGSQQEQQGLRGNYFERRSSLWKTLEDMFVNIRTLQTVSSKPNKFTSKVGQKLSYDDIVLAINSFRDPFSGSNSDISRLFTYVMERRAGQEPNVDKNRVKTQHSAGKTRLEEITDSDDRGRKMPLNISLISLQSPDQKRADIKGVNVDIFPFKGAEDMAGWRYFDDVNGWQTEEALGRQRDLENTDIWRPFKGSGIERDLESTDIWRPIKGSGIERDLENTDIWRPIKGSAIERDLKSLDTYREHKESKGGPMEEEMLALKLQTSAKPRHGDANMASKGFQSSMEVLCSILQFSTAQVIVHVLTEKFCFSHLQTHRKYMEQLRPQPSDTKMLSSLSLPQEHKTSRYGCGVLDPGPRRAKDPATHSWQRTARDGSLRWTIQHAEAPEVWSSTTWKNVRVTKLEAFPDLLRYNTNFMWLDLQAPVLTKDQMTYGEDTSDVVAPVLTKDQMTDDDGEDTSDVEAPVLTKDQMTDDSDDTSDVGVGETFMEADKVQEPTPSQRLDKILTLIDSDEVGSPSKRGGASKDKKLFVDGQDDRLRVFLSQMRKFPFSNIARLSTGCTGTLVTPRHVLTAAHCVHTGMGFRSNLEMLKLEIPDTMGFRVYYAQKISVPLGWLRDVSNQSHRGQGRYNQSQQAAYDYAVVRLKLPVTGRTRFLPLAVPRADVLTLNIHFLAFPEYEHGLWQSVCDASSHMAGLDGNLILTRCDAAVGNSGAAVFTNEPKEGMKVVGVLSNTMHVAHDNAYDRYSIITALTWPKLSDICRQLGGLAQEYNVCPHVRFLRLAHPPHRVTAVPFFGKRSPLDTLDTLDPSRYDLFEIK